MSGATQQGDLAIKRMGTAMRNMGLASLLVFVLPAIGFWYFYLAGQLAIAARDAAKAYNLDQFQKVRKITAANLIVSATFFLAASSLWFQAYTSDLLAGGSGYYHMGLPYFLTLIWGSGSCIVAWGITAACLNLGLWNAISGYFKTGSLVSSQMPGLKGCKSGTVGSAVGLIAWLLGVPTMILAHIFVSDTYSSPSLPTGMDVFVLFLFIILLGIALLHGFASVCIHASGFFKTGSVFREIEAIGMASRSSGLDATRDPIPTRQAAIPRTLFDAATYIPDPVPATGDVEGVPQHGTGPAGNGTGPASAEAPSPPRSPAPPSEPGTPTPPPVSNDSSVPAGQVQVAGKPKPQFCPHCGNPLLIDPDTKNCEFCGEKVNLG